MFFFLSKILRTCISPIFWIAVILTVTLITKNKTSKIRLIVAATCMFLFFSNNFIADEFMRAWEIKAVHQEDIQEHYDVGILLTGICTYDATYDRTCYKNSSDRLLQTMDLYHRGIIKNIFITGGSGYIREPEFKEAKLLYDFLVQSGIPKENINFEVKSRNTHENAVESAQYLRPETSDSTFLLITSAYHMRRAKACFIKEGFNCDVYSTDIYTGKRKYHIEHMLIPRLDAFVRWEIMFREVSGMLMYKINNYA